MRVRSMSLKITGILLIASSAMISCESKTSPLDGMKAPIQLVRNDSIIQVKDSAGQLYNLTTEERTTYRTAFLKPGEILAINGTE
ncbi:MAG: hypothetical protein JKX73_04445 [Flavobacteriales bacterium]|nr:hypothetical protein [Flavobacteriales bacterium]